MNIVKKSTPVTYKIYVARYIHERLPDGTVRKNYLSLEKQCGAYPDFSQAYVRVEAIRKTLTDHNGVSVLVSRSAGYCEDVMSLPVKKNSKDPRDCDDPGRVYVTIIATIWELELQ